MRPIGDDFRDRCRPPAGLVVGQERERADLPLSMTRRAASVKDRRDMLGVGHRPAALEIGGRRSWFLERNSPALTEETRRDSDRLTLGGAWRSIGQPTTWVISVETSPAGQHRVDRIGQIVMHGPSRASPGRTGRRSPRGSESGPGRRSPRLRTSVRREACRPRDCRCLSRSETPPPTAGHSRRRPRSSRSHWN